MFAWEATGHGTDIHPQAEPTQLTMLHKEFKDKKEDFKTDLQQSILEKYGGEEHLDALPKELLLSQTVCAHVHVHVDICIIAKTTMNLI